MKPGSSLALRGNHVRKNLSRKETIELKKEREHEKLKQKELKDFQKQRGAMLKSSNDTTGDNSDKNNSLEGNKKRGKDNGSSNVFDSSFLSLVSEGLNETIKLMKEEPMPLTMFACCITALSSPGLKRSQIPYLFVILGACSTHISQTVLSVKFPMVVGLASRIIAENSHDTLIVDKALKCVGEMASNLHDPKVCSSLFDQLRKLQPSKMNTLIMPRYLTMFRKFVQRCGLYEQPGMRQVFLEGTSLFVKLCCECLQESTVGIVLRTAVSEFGTLLKKTFSPSVIQDEATVPVIRTALSEEIIPLFKPVAKHSWGHAADLTATLFSHLSFLKRVQRDKDFLETFPEVRLLLRILDKIRVVDDADLNAHIEKAMIAIGNCIMVKQFLELVPFDPRSCGYIMDEEDPVWTRSYTVNLLRRIATHDSLIFCAETIVPIFRHCSTAVEEASEVFRVHWATLQQQYLRAITTFCLYPLFVDEKSVKVVAQTLILQLGKPSANLGVNGIRNLADSFYSLAITEENELSRDKSEGEEGSDDEKEEMTEEERRKNRRSNIEDDTEYLSYFFSDWDPHRFHGISKTRAIEVCDILRLYSKNVVPRLCNAIESNNSNATLGAIEAYAKVCSPEVMSVILKGIIDVGNEEAANAMTEAKRRVILDIACTIVKELPAENLNVIFENVIYPVLKNTTADQRLLHKRAYKLLYAMLENCLKDLIPFLPRIVELLYDNQNHVTVSAIKMRVKCISCMLDAYKMFNPEGIKVFCENFVPEIVLLARERGSNTRELAMDILERMQRYLESSGYGSSALLQLVLTGLAGRTPMMISSSIVALAKVVSCCIEKLSEKKISGTVSLISRLIEHSSTEVRSSAALFLRMMFKHCRSDPKCAAAVEAYLPVICNAVANITAQPDCSSASKDSMHVLLEKCIKHFGYDRIESVFPEDSKRFLVYCSRLLRREEKKQRRRQELSARSAAKSYFNEMFMDLTNGPALRIGAENTGEETADLLESGAMNNIVAHKPVPSLWRQEDEEDDPSDRMCVITDGERVVVMTKEEREAQLDKERRQRLADRLLRRGGDGGEKRGRDEDEAEDDQNEELVLRYGTEADKMKAKEIAAKHPVESNKSRVSEFIQKRIEKRGVKKARFEQDIKKGEEFAGTGSSGLGDVKKGNLDPFSYVPLDRRFMNKRNKVHGLQRFSSVVHKANKKGGKANMPNKSK